MLQKRLLALSISTLLLTACGGDDGSNGINGTAGINGTNGINGTDGINGTNGIDASRQIISLTQTGRTESQGFAVSAAEIVAYDSARDRVFTVNANTGEVDYFSSLASISNAPAGTLNLASLLLAANVISNVAEAGAANSIAIHGDVAAVAVEAVPKTDNGWVVFINLTDLSLVRAVDVGALPDMVTFTPDGSKVLVANEGEPNEGYSVDPEGSVSVITVANGAVTTIGFTDFNEGGSRYSELDLSKMILDGYSATNTGNKASVAESLEPEYITVAEDGSEAYVALQENNAIAVLDLTDNSIDRIFGLGFKNHSIPGNELDASDEDGVNIKNWPVMGMYMPDAIASYTVNGVSYLVTANEGDSREDWLVPVSDQNACETAGYYFYGGECVDEVRLKHLSSRAGLLVGDPITAMITEADRLKVSYHTTRIMNGNSRADGTDKSQAINKVYAYGARSFSIWNTVTGEQVFDSGSAFERITAQRFGDNFNSNHEENGGDARSDDKGIEPEGIAIGTINGYTYAFIGLERMGGIMVYDISNPFAPEYVQYLNNRDFTQIPGDGVDAGDLGQEGLKFVPAANSPDGKPYLIVGSEVSGTTTVYEINMATAQ